MNPFLQNWTLPFELPPFATIKDEHFGPAFEQAFTQSRTAISTIAQNPAAPTFANTIEALERAYTLMNKVAGVFFNLSGSNSNPALEALQRDLSPKFAAFNSETMMNAALFVRVKTLFDAIGNLDLTPEQNRVLTLYHRMFVRAGAALKGADRTRLAEVSKRLAVLGTAFTQNLLADER